MPSAHSAITFTRTCATTRSAIASVDLGHKAFDFSVYEKSLFPGLFRPDLSESPKIDRDDKYCSIDDSNHTPTGANMLIRSGRKAGYEVSLFARVNRSDSVRKSVARSILSLLLNESPAHKVSICLRLDLVVFQTGNGSVHLQHGKRDLIDVVDAMLAQSSV